MSGNLSSSYFCNRVEGRLFLEPTGENTVTFHLLKQLTVSLSPEKSGPGSCQVCCTVGLSGQCSLREASDFVCWWFFFGCVGSSLLRTGFL